MLISIVIPVYNELENLPHLVAEISRQVQSLKRKGIQTELILVDDGSRDGSFKEIQRLRGENPWVRAIRFRRNFGQTAAFDAGFSQARGEVVITMDGDLQNDPADIPLLLDKLSEGFDVVSGWRFDRKDAAFSKKLPSLLSNWLARSLTGLELHDFGCSLKAYGRESLKDLRLFGEMHRFIPAILYTKGFKIAEVKVRHRPRRFGKTKYNFTRLLKGFLDLLYIKFWSSFSTRPLHLFGLMGFGMMFIAGLIAIVKLSLLLFYSQPIEVTPALLLGVLFAIMGLLFIMFGFLGEVQVRTYYNTSKEHEYEIERKI